MKGTEKQIAFANNIIQESRNTIAANIARFTELGLERDVKIWNMVSEQYETAISKIDNAAFVIDHRTSLGSNGVMSAYNQINIMVSSGKIKL